MYNLNIVAKGFQVIVLLTGVCVCLRATKVLLFWIGVELKTVGTLPLLLGRGGGAIRYYLAQAGGRFLLIGGLVREGLVGMALGGLFVKLGLVPYFQWYLDLLPRLP